MKRFKINENKNVNLSIQIENISNSLLSFYFSENVSNDIKETSV